MRKLNALALANTLGLIVLIMHPFFHIWTYFSPNTYQLVVRMFFPGFRVVIDPFDYNISIVLISTLLKSAVFWIFFYLGATIYNKLTKDH